MKSAFRDQSPRGDVDLTQSMINIEKSKYGNTRNLSPQLLLPKPSIEERKKIIDNMRRENKKRFTSINSVMSTKTAHGDISSETARGLSVEQTI